MFAATWGPRFSRPLFRGPSGWARRRGTARRSSLMILPARAPRVTGNWRGNSWRGKVERNETPMQPDAPLPPLNYHGYLPEGVHETTLEHMRERFAINPKRVLLWGRFREFLSWAVSTGQFS